MFLDFTNIPDDSPLTGMLKNYAAKAVMEFVI